MAFHIHRSERMNARIPLTKVLVFSLLLPLFAATSPARAQVVYNNASTAGESYAKGYADVVRAKGDTAVQASIAAGNFEDAYSKDLNNRKLATQTYFEMRKMNSEYRAAEKDRYRQQCSEAMARHAQVGKPERLSAGVLDPVSGKVYWPALLDADQHAANRKALDELFAKRAYEGKLTTAEMTQLRTACLAMLDDLNKQRRIASPTDYDATDKFIHSLAREGQSPVA
jgi:hypothetical protein